MITTRSPFLNDGVVRAQGPDLEASELMALSVHHDAEVRASVAQRRDCPVGALICLGHDYDPQVLLALIANPRTPSSVIRTLADSTHVDVAVAAMTRLSRIAA